MKSISILFFVGLLSMAGCQQAAKTPIVDVDAETAAINEVVNKLNDAMRAQDVTGLAAALCDEALVAGSDPTEFWNKAEIVEAWTQMLAQMKPEFEIFSDRAVKLSPDGKSATVIEQYMFPAMAGNLPCRNTMHLIKMEEGWRVLYAGSAFVPYNKDIAVLSKALEEKPAEE